MSGTPLPLSAPSAPPTAEPAEPAELAEALAALVDGCAGVVSLSAGVFGEVATYLPGRRVRGIRLSGDAVEVHVVADWGAPLPGLAERVRAACKSLTGDRPVDVYVDDLQIPEILAPRG